MEGEQCGTCKFWGDLGAVGNSVGECRRLPPVIPAGAEPDESLGYYHGWWPVTETRDWCGEYRRAEGGGA